MADIFTDPNYTCPFACSPQVDAECPCYSSSCAGESLVYGEVPLACYPLIENYCLESDAAARFVRGISAVKDEERQ